MRSPMGAESNKPPLPESFSKLAMPLPLVAAGHSMLPDMQFGWKPQADKEIPPIPFCFGLVYYNLEQFNYHAVLYVGPRFTNSYKMHEQYANKKMQLPNDQENEGPTQVQAYPFTFPKFYNSNNFTYEEAFQHFLESLEDDSSLLDQDLKFKLPSSHNKNGQRGDKNTLLTALSYKDEKEEYLFDSNFESGNLDFVGKVQENEFDLLMRLDSNSRSHQQWYYFSIDCKDIKKRMTKGETIKLNIMNFTKPNTLYNQGMRPVAWSKQKCLKEGVGWHRAGQNISYKMSKLSRQNLQANNGGYQRIWYQMSFEYTFEYDHDKIYFAYAIPYTFSMLFNFIKAVEDIQKKPENLKNSMIFKKEILGKSLSGVEIPILTITDFNETIKAKKTIVMVGRLHPGETHSSWLIHGFIRFILSENPKARELRNKVIFKIVPMLNPDGVIVGNYRCTLAGCDMNRNFGGETPAAQRLNPETLLFKKMAKQQTRLAFFFDVHSHSSKKSIFIYGPYHPLHSEHYLKIRVLPRLLAERTQMFRYYSCRFRNETHKVNCSRLTIFRDCNLPQCYTIETSIMGFLNKDRQNVSFGIPSLQYFGEKLGETLLDWFQIIEAHQREKIRKAIIMSRERKTRKRTIIDIIGEEDYQEFKEVIDTQLNEYQIQQDNEEQIQLLQRKQTSKGKKGSRRKSMISNTSGNNNKRKKNTNDNETFGKHPDIGQVASTSEPMGSNQCINIVDNFLEGKDAAFSFGKKIPSQKKSSKQVKNGNSTEEEEDDDDEDFPSHGAQTGLMQALKPMMYFPGEKEEDLTTNRGFYVSKLAGFEYLEGPELLQKATKQLREKLSIPSRQLNGDILNSTTDNASRHQHLIMDDDEKFLYEDQARADDQHIRRFEDIVGDIRKDLIKATPTVPQSSSVNVNHNQQQQFYEEEDLDSQRSEGGDNTKQGCNDFLDEEYDLQMIKMQECLTSYFDNVEDLQNNSSNGKARAQGNVKKQQQMAQAPIQVVIKENKPKALQVNNSNEGGQMLAGTSINHRASPIKYNRLQSAMPSRQNQEVLIPQKKEIVFQLKKPAITNFPPEFVKPRTANSRPYKGNNQLLAQHNGSPVQQQQVPYQGPLDAKDLSFTLMHRTNQEFFELLQKYVHTKAPPQPPPFQQRAVSALATGPRDPNQRKNIQQNNSMYYNSTGSHSKQLENRQLLQQMHQYYQEVHEQPRTSSVTRNPSNGLVFQNNNRRIEEDECTRNSNAMQESTLINQSMLNERGLSSTKKPQSKASQMDPTEVTFGVSPQKQRRLVSGHPKNKVTHTERQKHFSLMVDGKSVQLPPEQQQHKKSTTLKGSMSSQLKPKTTNASSQVQYDMTEVKKGNSRKMSAFKRSTPSKPLESTGGSQFLVQVQIKENPNTASKATFYHDTQETEQASPAVGRRFVHSRHYSNSQQSHYEQMNEGGIGLRIQGNFGQQQPVNEQINKSINREQSPALRKSQTSGQVFNQQNSTSIEDREDEALAQFYYKQHLNNFLVDQEDGESSPITYIKNPIVPKQSNGYSFTDTSLKEANAYRSNLPMKNQMLIDMFRQANSHSSAAPHRSSMNLNPQAAAALMSNNEIAGNYKRKSNRLIVNISAGDDSNSSQADRLRVELLSNSLININLTSKVSPDKLRLRQQQQRPVIQSMVVQHNATS